MKVEGLASQGEHIQLVEEFAESMAAAVPAQGYWVALSGGLDSMVLAHLAQQVLPAVRFIHINHGLSPHAEAWQQQVVSWAQSIGLAGVCLSVQVEKSGLSLEAAARAARYQAFESILKPGEALLCGHHQQDQAETFCLRLMRGSGLTGLAAMAPSRSLGCAVLLRPLLNIPRARLLAYAQAHRFNWVEDESNQDLRFDRNWLRHALMPTLAQRWPKASEQIAQTCLRLQQAQQLLQEYLAADLLACAPRAERLGHSMLLAPLAQVSDARRSGILRCWFDSLGTLPPSQAVLAQMHALIHSRADSEACVSWGRWHLRRYNGRLYVLPQVPALSPDWQAQWHTQVPLLLANGSCVSAAPSAEGLAPGTYTLRLRQGGERSHPAQRQHSQTLKKLLQEAALEPWLRNQLPLVYRDNCLVAVGDLWLERGHSVVNGVQLKWHF